MTKHLLNSFLIHYNIPFEENVSLSKKTWIKTGGICSYWIVPQTKQQLTDLCKYLYANRIKFDVVGQTSNIFIHSTYNPEVIVSTIKVNKYTIDDSIITCDCGVSVIKLAKESLDKGYAGFYGLVGLPGTVASSVYNNAGCFNCSISSMLDSVEWLSPNGSVQILNQDAFAFTRRSSAFKRKEIEGVLLSVKLRVTKADDIEEEKKKSEETIIYRKANQEGPYKNLGSCFCEMSYRRNVRNLITNLFVKACVGMKIVEDKRAFRKKTLLALYGYRDLDHYISDKSIITFVWRDNGAEQKFKRYKGFMNKVFKDLVQEIEEKQ